MGLIDFDRGVYALAWAAFRANYEVFAALALLIVFADPVVELAGISDALPFARSTVIPIMIYQVAAWSLMHDGRPFAGQEWRQVRFVRFALWTILMMLPALVAGIAMLRDAGLPVMLAGVYAGYILTLAACGTVLPEIAAGGRGNLAAALRRGRRAFLPALGDLLRGPVVFALAVLLAGVLPQVIGIPVWVLDPNTGAVSWLGTVMVLAVDLMSVFADVLMAAALCKAWHRGGGATA
jgi:hypothetical protein